MHILIGLVLTLLWIALAVLVLGILWGFLVSLPLWAVGLGARATHDAARSLPPPRSPPRLPDWLFLCGVVVLGALVCAIWNPGWGMVALGVGATVLYAKQNWRRVRQGVGGGCN
jgi:hypothetical protein